ncbi:uncharacterized protein LOC106010118 [Heterocephalus glaber]|uniref:Uncharacterized protein LOC106010118 n=1 Tax=Heterocephalus glaber TaxID=10181 RepID=A0AAX6TMA2_HETGA|nr:uncharacterized protein LOC106010118 [Heterocephalus glaber]
MEFATELPLIAISGFSPSLIRHDSSSKSDRGTDIWEGAERKEEREKGSVRTVTLTTPFLLIFKDFVKILLLIASGMARSNCGHLLPLWARLEAAVLPPRSFSAWAAFGLQHPDAEPSRTGWTEPDWEVRKDTNRLLPALARGRGGPGPSSQDFISPRPARRPLPTATRHRPPRRATPALRPPALQSPAAAEGHAGRRTPGLGGGSPAGRRGSWIRGMCTWVKQPLKIQPASFSVRFPSPIAPSLPLKSRLPTQAQIKMRMFYR